MYFVRVGGCSLGEEGKGFVCAEVKRLREDGYKLGFRVCNYLLFEDDDDEEYERIVRAE